MTISCKNCNTHFKGNFCHACGQSAKTHRLDVHSLWHDVQHGLLHVDKGIVYTITQLFIRPGHSIREYIEGKRVRHFKPISLLIILATVYVLLNHFLKLSIVKETESTVETNISGINFSFSGAKSQLSGIKEFIEYRFAFLQIALLPYYALCTWFAFRKSGYNIIEHLVVNAFIRGQVIIISTLLLPVVYYGLLSKSSSEDISILMEIGIFLWTFIQLFNKRHIFYTIPRVFLSMVCFILGQFVLLNLVLYL